MDKGGWFSIRRLEEGVSVESLRPRSVEEP
jgi:hypothetical protein